MNSQRSDVGTLLAQIAGLAAQYRRSVIILTLVVLLLSGGLAASSVQLDMGVGLYLGDDSEAAEDWASVEETYDRGNAVFVVLDGRDVTDPATIRIIDALDRQYTQLDEVSRSSSLADVVRAGAGGRIPDSEQAVERAIGRVRTQSPASAELVDSVLPSNTRTQLILSYGELRSAGDEGPFGLIVRKDAERVESAVKRATDRIRVPEGLTLTITGPGILEMAAFELMLIDALALFAGGFLVVLVVVYLVMRRRLHSGLQALYSLVVALASVIVMLGGMGLLGFDFNAIMIAVLPVGVGLSVDYALQLHTRYAEERTTGVPPAEAAETAAATTGRALGLAMGTTVVGFGSLLASPVPPVRQFGVTAAIVVAAAFVFALTLLVALLVTTDRRTGHSGPWTLSPDTGALEGCLTRVGGLIAQEPLIVLLLVIPLLAGGAAAYPQIDTTQEILDYWPRDLTERKQFENTLETTASPKTVYALVETADVYEPETIRAIDRFQSRIASLHHVNAVGGPISALRSITGGTIPDDRERIETLLTKASHGPLTSTTPPDTHPNEVLITARIGDIEGREISALVEDIHAAAATELPDASVTVTGTPVVTRAVIENTTEGLGRMTVLSFVAAVCFLVLAFRSLRDAMMLLAVPAAAATFVLAAMALIGVPWNPGTVSLAPIALGIGIDYGLHIHERYSEGRTAGQEPALAVESAMGSLSRPIVASGMTTVAGFGVLMFSQFPVVRNFGITLVLVVAFSMLSAFVFLPAMLLVVDQEQPLKEQLLNRLGLGVGMDAKSEPLDLSDLPVPANEDVTAFARSANSEMVISGDTGTLRHTGEVAVVTTDRRVICVVRNDAEDPIVRSITLPSIRECDIEDGIRFRELSLRTQDDEIYRLRLTDGVALDPVIEEIGSGTEPSAAVRRHLDEVAEAITILEETPSVDEGLWATVDWAQDHLTAAEGLIDQISASESERLETLKREFRDAVHAAALAAGETKRLNAERHREAGRYTKASQAYRTALRILERGLETAEPVIGDLPGPVHQRRDHIQQRLSTLYQEVKGSAQDAVEEARSLEDPAQSIESWETALQHGQTAVALADTDEDFPGSVSTLKADLRRVAELCLAAHRDRAERLMSTAEALGADTALRDETYERAEIHLERAREIASEFGVGNPAAIETTIDRLTAKRRASSSASD